MKTKLAGILSFVGSLGWTITLFILFYDHGIYDTKDVIILLSGIIPSISTLMYVLWTKFGKYHSELSKLDYENKILIKKIEQKELKSKLEK